MTKRLERRDGAPLFLVEPHVHAALVTGSIAKLVVLPEYLDVNEWLAANGERVHTRTRACEREWTRKGRGKREGGREKRTKGTARATEESGTWPQS